MQRAAALTILKIREFHCLPQSVMGAVMSDFQSLFDVALLTLKHCISSTAEVDSGIIKEITHHFEIPSSYTSLF